jgi:hypothetical protein
MRVVIKFHKMLLWMFPLDRPEADRLALFTAAAPERPVDRAVQHALHARWTAAQIEVQQAIRAAGGAGDRAALLQGALLTKVGRPKDARDLALTRLPYLQGDRIGTAAAYLVAAEASLKLGFLKDAVLFCTEAAETARSPAARALRIPSRLVWAAVSAEQGDLDQALFRVRSAERVRLSPLEQHFVDATMARLLAASGGGGLMGSLTRLHNAIESAPTALRRSELEHEYQSLEQRRKGPLPGPRTAEQTRRDVRMQLLDGLSLQVDGTLLPVPGAARAVLLLTYLQTHDGTSLTVLEDQLLKPREPHDETLFAPAAPSVARVRQLLSRARTLIGDPSAVTCYEGAVFLSRRYRWSSDLNDALVEGTYDASRLPPGLACDWLEGLQALSQRS